MTGPAGSWSALILLLARRFHNDEILDSDDEIWEPFFITMARGSPAAQFPQFCSSTASSFHSSRFIDVSSHIDCGESNHLLILLISSPSNEAS
jgi:hypothetical protein